MTCFSEVNLMFLFVEWTDIFFSWIHMTHSCEWLPSYQRVVNWILNKSDYFKNVYVDKLQNAKIVNFLTKSFFELAILKINS